MFFGHPIASLRNSDAIGFYHISLCVTTSKDVHLDTVLIVEISCSALCTYIIWTDDLIGARREAVILVSEKAERNCEKRLHWVREASSDVRSRLCLSFIWTCTAWGKKKASVELLLSQRDDATMLGYVPARVKIIKCVSGAEVTAEFIRREDWLWILLQREKPYTITTHPVLN